MKYLVYVSIITTYLATSCENSRRPIYEPKPIPENSHEQGSYETSPMSQEQQRINESINQVYQYIDVLGFSTYTDEDLNKKTKFKIKNKSRKTITNVVIGHFLFHENAENVKTSIKPGQTKTMITNVEAAIFGTTSEPNSMTNYKVICIRFSDGSTVGYLK